MHNLPHDPTRLMARPSGLRARAQGLLRVLLSQYIANGLAVSLGFGYGFRGTWLERPKQFAPAQHDFKSTIKYLILLKI